MNKLLNNEAWNEKYFIEYTVNGDRITFVIKYIFN